MIRNCLERWFEQIWYRDAPWFLVLVPFSWLYCLVTTVRRHVYRNANIGSVTLPVKVLVVGNITTGGSGKTPLVIALAQLLQRQGVRTGIVSRGYAGKAKHWPQQVTADSDPGLVGEEAVLLAAATGLPVFAGPDRVQAVRALLEDTPVDAVISDDGLQHYRMQRDLEICVIDASRGLGNGWCLPAGPLREPSSRLKSVDMVVTLGTVERQHWIHVKPGKVLPVCGTGVARKLNDFRGERVHAVAGIGNPWRFFEQLRQAGIDCIEHVFSDHHHFRPSDLAFSDHRPVLMTGKDAVKCQAFAEPHWWFVTTETELAPAVEKQVLELFPSINNRKSSLGQKIA